MNCSMPGFLVRHHLPEFVQVHVRRVSDAIQPSLPLPPSSPFTFSFSQKGSIVALSSQDSVDNTCGNAKSQTQVN